jgi:hypothetical protein
MNDLSLFEVYRRLLAFVVSTYIAVRIAMFVWRWQASFDRSDRVENVLRRYAVTLLLTSRFRRFWIDLLQIAVLVVLFICIVRMHS